METRKEYLKEQLRLECAIENARQEEKPETEIKKLENELWELTQRAEEQYGPAWDIAQAKGE
jgi:hypothetical protein